MSKKVGSGNHDNYPTAYDEVVVREIMEAHTGAGTARELSRELGIAMPTFMLWQREKPEFKEMVRAVRAIADDQVEASLHERATGYIETTEDKAYERDEKTGKMVISKRTVKEHHVAADTAAAKFWLGNRRKEDWTERKVVEVEHKHGDLLKRIEQEVLDLPEDEYEDVTPDE